MQYSWRFTAMNARPQPGRLHVRSRSPPSVSTSIALMTYLSDGPSLSTRGLRGPWRPLAPGSNTCVPETLGGAQQAEPEPAPPHVPLAPALDVPRDVPQGSDQILDAVRRREEAPQRRRQPQLQHRERFLQPFAHTGRGIGLAVPLQPRHEGRQLAARRRDAGRLIRAAQGGPDVGLPCLWDERVEIAPLVWDDLPRHPSALCGRPGWPLDLNDVD